MEKSEYQEQNLEEERKKQQFKNVLFYIMIGIVISLSLYLIYFVKTDSYKCMSNPLIYGVNHIDTKEDVTCSCSIPSSDKTMIITKENISYQDFSLFDSSSIK